MNDTATLAAGCCKFELEIEIEAPKERVWKAIFEESDRWWLPDFRVVAADSTIEFDPSPGGRGLIESTSDGGGLQWYAVQMYLPAQFKVYLIGHIAADWGGPTTSSLQISLEESEKGTVFKLTDARHGNVDENSIKSSEQGWNQLFRDGLKQHVESSNR